MPLVDLDRRRFAAETFALSLLFLPLFRRRFLSVTTTTSSAFSIPPRNRTSSRQKTSPFKSESESLSLFQPFHNWTPFLYLRIIISSFHHNIQYIYIYIKREGGRIKVSSHGARAQRLFRREIPKESIGGKKLGGRPSSRPPDQGYVSRGWVEAGKRRSRGGRACISCGRAPGFMNTGVFAHGAPIYARRHCRVCAAA